MKALTIPVDRFIKNPNNIRTDFGAASKNDLVASIKAHGIKVPLIGYEIPEGIMLSDGHCRLEAAIELELKELPVVVFPKKPDEAEFLATQLTINGHRHALNPVDEYLAFTRLAKLNGWNASQLAAGLAVSNAEITRVLSIGKLSAEERQLVRDGKISKSAAYALTRMSAEERTALARQAANGEISRDQLNNKARRKGKSETMRTQRVSCPLAGGTVSVQAPSGLNLSGLIDLLDELMRECKKARTQGLDISTAVRVLRDRNRALPAP